MNKAEEIARNFLFHVWDDPLHPSEQEKIELEKERKQLAEAIQFYADEQSREEAIKFGEWMVLISKRSAEKYYDEWKSNQEDKG